MSIEQEKMLLDRLHTKIIKHCADKVSQDEINALMNAKYKITGQKPKYNDNAKVYFCPLCERKVVPNYDMYCSGCGHFMDYSELNNQDYSEEF